MTAEIHTFTGNTTLDIPAERMLNAALSADLATCLTIGYDQEGELYFASTTSNAPRILWLLEKAKMFILSQ